MCGALVKLASVMVVVIGAIKIALVTAVGANAVGLALPDLLIFSHKIGLNGPIACSCAPYKLVNISRYIFVDLRTETSKLF